MGQSKTCTVTNNDKAPSLTVIKHVVNDNGGTKTAADFTMNVTGTNVSTSSFAGSESPGTTVTLSAGSYSVDETAVTGYTKSLSSDCSGTIAVGQTKTCTITNDDKAATLTLTKTVVKNNGGTAVDTDFTLIATGPTTINGVEGNAAVTNAAVNAGNYTLSESGPSGYTAGIYSCSINGGIAVSSNSLSLTNGDSATCDVTNDDQAAHLKLVKVVTNTNGGTAVATDWTLSAAGPTPLSGAGGAESDVNAGEYTLSETMISGYTNGTFFCNGGSLSGDKLTLANGQSATCTVTNTDQAAKLTLVKVVDNNYGGTATATDFTLTATGPDKLTGAGGASGSVKAGGYALSETTLTGYTPGNWSCVGGNLNGSNLTLKNGEEATCTITNTAQAAHLTLTKTVTNNNGGTAAITDFTLSATGPTPITGAGSVDSAVSAGMYTLSETNLPGYTAGSWNCTGGAFTAPDKITLALGQTASCTISNDDAASLTLVKTVTNNNGGLAAPADFTLSATGPTSISGTGGATSDSTFKAGTYTLSETNLPGYTAGNWNCTGGTFVSPDKITVTLGQSASCTIVNNDDAAHLKLVKTVTNDNGGATAAAAWTLNAAGPTPLSGAGGAESDVDAGEYTLSETTVSGYTNGTFSCNGGSLSGDKLTLANGQNVTCTVVNDDQTAHLKLVKVVDNTNGGTAVAADWTLSAAGPTPLSGAGGAESDVDAGEYTLSETTVSGYTNGTFSCNGGTLAGNKLTLANGQSATCTVTNTAQAAKLTLIKVVTNNNGGTAATTDFSLTATGPDILTGKGGASGSVKAGYYVLSETGPSTYNAGTWNCIGVTQSGSNITVNPGDEATCTITNDDIAPKLHLRKIVSGGTATVAAFTLTANGTGTNDLSGTSPVDSGVNLQADTWALSETAVSGYTNNGWVCVGGTQNGSNITVGIGGEATCTITNTFIPPGQCVLTQGYWKTHVDQWPVSSITLGTVSYTKTQLLRILNQPVQGNGLISLAYQLIAAKLNLANGTIAPKSVQDAIAAADSLIGNRTVPPIGSGSLSASATSSFTAILDSFNNGLIAGGPTHCG